MNTQDTDFMNQLQHMLGKLRVSDIQNRKSIPRYKAQRLLKLLKEKREILLKEIVVIAELERAIKQNIE